MIREFHKSTRELHEITERVESTGWVPIQIRPASMSCRSCGEVIPDGALKCNVCGTVVSVTDFSIEKDEEACLIVVAGSMAGDVLPLKFEVHVLGRGEEADLVLLDLEVSRRHARFKRYKDHYVVEDLNSANGTWINGHRIQEKRLLMPGDRVRLGQTELVVRYNPIQY